MAEKWARFGLLMVVATLAVVVLVTWLYGLQGNQGSVTVGGLGGPVAAPELCVQMASPTPDCVTTP
jgi:hypothetical protein